jgi:hypothetical protein
MKVENLILHIVILITSKKRFDAGAYLFVCINSHLIVDTWTGENPSTIYYLVKLGFTGGSNHWCVLVYLIVLALFGP